MKFGFRIVIHKDVPKDLMKEAEERCYQFLQLASNREKRVKYHEPDNKGKKYIIPASYATGYRKSFYNRRVLGHVFADNKLTFRRLSTNRRIFGVVPTSLIEEYNGEINYKQCRCPIHLGGTRIKMPFVEDDYNFYAEVGEIKG